MQAVQRNEREKRLDGGTKKEKMDDPHTSAAKRKRPLRIFKESIYICAAKRHLEGAKRFMKVQQSTK